MKIKIDVFGLDSISEFDEQFVDDTIKLGMSGVGEQILDEFHRIVEPWQNETPIFDIDTYWEGKNYICHIYPTDQHSHGKDKFEWLDEGTPVRHMKMNFEFERKTHPYSLDVNPGERGNPYYVKDPLPGIEPRMWRYLIVKKYRKEFEEDMKTYVNVIADIYF